MTLLVATGASTGVHGDVWYAGAHTSHLVTTGGLWQPSQEKMSSSISVKCSSLLNLNPRAQVGWKLPCLMFPLVKRVKGGGVREGALSTQKLVSFGAQYSFTKCFQAQPLPARNFLELL